MACGTWCQSHRQQQPAGESRSEKEFASGLLTDRSHRLHQRSEVAVNIPAALVVPILGLMTILEAPRLPEHEHRRRSLINVLKEA